jgi:menaquinone-dependent protoporphyrinogen IX oxidase
MRSIVIYHSRYGNTERVARAIAEGLSERGEALAVAVGDLRPVNVETAQLVVLGAPTQMKSMSLSMRRFLRRTSRSSWFGRPVAVFDTRFHDDPQRSGSAAAVLARRLRAMGAMLVRPPESFFVSGMKGPLREGELDRARLWGRGLHLADRVTVED